MAEPKEPKSPPAGTPGAPLPRLWKAEPDEEPEPEKTSKKKPAEAAAVPAKAVRLSKKSGSGKTSKDVKKAREGEPKGVLKEETPTFDTHETRQKVRIIIGSVLTVFFVIGGFIVYRQLSPRATVADVEIPPQYLSITSTAGTQPLRDEEEAQILFDRAKEVARNRNTKLAVSILKRVRSKYPSTKAANEAKEALDRPSQDPPLPLFLDRPTLVAKADPREAKSEPPKPAAPVVEAIQTAVARATGADARLNLPANASEVPAIPAPVHPGASVSQSRPLPKGFQPRPGTEVHESGWPLEIVGDRDGAPMLLVPGGVFVQGRDGAESNEGPSHKVTLGTFYVDKHEVTVRQFDLFQKEAGKRTERIRALAKDPAHAKPDAEDDRPVVMVSARDAKDYADWAGKFLPTEAQWEGAARTPDGRIFPWGTEPPAWTKPRAPRQIDPVMSFPNDVSPYGAYDLAGNAWEWTKDWYDAKYYQQFRTAQADNPTGPAKPRSQQLVVKGAAKDWTVAKREGFKFDTRLPYLGFRCVLQVEGPGNAFEPPPPPPGPGQPAPVRLPGGGVVVPF